MTDITTLFVPGGTGPYNVEGATYEVTDGKISVHNPGHVSMLKALGASETPFDGLTYGARVQSDFGPTQAEHDALRARHDELVLQASTVNDGLDQIDTVLSEISGEFGIERNSEDDTLTEARYVLATLAARLREATQPGSGTDTPADTGDASGDTSESLDGASEIADPGFTMDSDYKAILDWLKNHGAAVPGNISKADALTAVASVVDASKKKG